MSNTADPVTVCEDDDVLEIIQVETPSGQKKRGRPKKDFLTYKQKRMLKKMEMLERRNKREAEKEIHEEMLALGYKKFKGVYYTNAEANRLTGQEGWKGGRYGMLSQRNSHLGVSGHLGK